VSNPSPQKYFTKAWSKALIDHVNKW